MTSWDYAAFGLQPVATDVAGKEWRQEQGRAHATFNALAAEIGNAVAAGRSPRNAVRRFLRHPKARLSAAIRVLGAEPNKGAAQALGSSVKAWRRVDLPVTWWLKPKRSGGHRIICSLPLPMKAAHVMISATVQQLFERRQNIYGVKDHGPDKAARQLKDLQNSGYVYLAHVDIVDCFQSVNPDALYQLAIGREVVRNSLDTRNMRFTERGGGLERTILSERTAVPFVPHVAADRATGPRSLMQGSPTSSIILAWLLNGIPSWEDARVILCFDNIIVAARTPARGRQAIEALAAHFERCPAGPLALCEPEYADNEPIEFLGYLFDPQRQDIGISYSGMERAIRRLSEAGADYEMLLLDRWTELQDRVVGNTMFASDDPFEGCLPIEVWRRLRDVAAGYPEATNSCGEIRSLHEHSAYLAEMTDAHSWFPRAAHLHENLFVDRDTAEGAMIRKLLNADRDRRRS